MNKAYNKITWQNKPSTATPLNQTNLNEMSNALDTIDDRVIALDSGKVSSVTVTNTLQTGDTIATITVDGTATNIKSAQVEVDAEPSATSENPLQNKAIYEMLNNLLPEETAEGNPIAISDASGLNAKACSVDLLPIQDLHGYDSPWVGGAGKNKFQTTATSQTINGTIFTVNADGSVTIKNTPSNNISNFNFGIVTLPAGTYKANGFSGGASNNIRMAVYDNTHGVQLAIIYQNRDVEFTLTETSEVRVYPLVLTNFDGNEVTMYPMIRLASVSDATFAPYSNICPISGRTELNLAVRGVNQWDEQWEVGSYNSSGVKVSSSGNIRTKNFIPCFPSTMYYLKSSSAGGRLCYYDKTQTFISTVAGTNIVNTSFTTPQNCYYITFNTDTAYGETYKSDISFNYPSTDTEYHAYQGETYTETLGQTVYGGKVDFVSGTATIDRAFIEYDGSNDENWDISSTSGNPVARIAKPSSITTNIICNSFERVGSSSALSESGKYFIGGSNLVFSWSGTLAEWKTYISATPIQLCWVLSTPTTLTLTAEQISLLKGNNVISTDGDNIKLVYSADIGLYIAGQLQNS